jgi:hydrogenase 3 maturation protease
MDFLPVIERLAREKTCFIGMGNYLMRDDAVGLHIVDGIKDRIDSACITTLNVEDVIENYVYRIADGDSDNVVIIDAIQSGWEIGSVLFCRMNELDEVINNFSTHKLSLILSGKVLEKHDKKVWFLGIEARDIDFGTGLSEDVKKSADIIRDLLLTYINCDQKELVYEH